MGGRQDTIVPPVVMELSGPVGIGWGSARRDIAEEEQASDRPTAASRRGCLYRDEQDGPLLLFLYLLTIVTGMVDALITGASGKLSIVERPVVKVFGRRVLGGINIYCGSFRGEDKSGSAFEGVLAEMDTVASALEAAAIARIRSALNDASDHISITADDARLLQALLRRSHFDLDRRLTVPGAPLDQMARDDREGANSTALKYAAWLG